MGFNYFLWQNYSSSYISACDSSQIISLSCNHFGIFIRVLIIPIFIRTAQIFHYSIVSSITCQLTFISISDICFCHNPILFHKHIFNHVLNVFNVYILAFNTYGFFNFIGNFARKRGIFSVNFKISFIYSYFNFLFIKIHFLSVSFQYNHILSLLSTIWAHSTLFVMRTVCL